VQHLAAATRALSPNDVSGTHGHVFNISTEPALRLWASVPDCAAHLVPHG